MLLIVQHSLNGYVIHIMRLIYAIRNHCMCHISSTNQTAIHCLYSSSCYVIGDRFECDTIATVWPEELRNDCGCKDRAEDAAAASLDHSAIADNNVLNGGPNADRYVARLRAEEAAAVAEAKIDATSKVDSVPSADTIVASAATNENNNDNIAIS
jgi:hypothetical protein